MWKSILIVALVAACIDNEDFESDEAELASENVERVIATARSKLGTSGGECKEWARYVVTKAIGVVIPSNAGSLYEWNTSSVVTAVAAWRASYAAGRIESTIVAANGTIERIVRINNGDPYVAVAYGPATLRLDVIEPNGRVTSDLSIAPAGTISRQFSGVGDFRIRVRNTGAVAQRGTVAMISRSRFVSDWETARRADVIQMRIDASGSGTGDTPHTVIVQSDFQRVPSNWLHSNWCPTANGLVCERSIAVDEMIRRSNRLPTFGFTIYRLK